MPKPNKEAPPPEMEYEEDMDFPMEDEEGENGLMQVIKRGMHFSVPFSFKLTKENSSASLPLEFNAITTVSSISLSASNNSSEKHIVELCHGAKHSELKTVIARLLPGVVETIYPCMSFSAHTERARLNLLYGDGPVDVTGVIEMDLSKDQDIREYMEENHMDYLTDEEGEAHHGEKSNKSARSSEDKEAMRSEIKKKLMENALSEPKRKSDVAVSFENKVKSSEAHAKEERPKSATQSSSVTSNRTFREVKGVKIYDVKEGSGPTLTQGKKASVTYVLRLNNENGRIIDQTTDNRKFKFRLGEGSVISGWEIGASGMKVGGKRILIIPPHLAYGKKGSPPEVPPNSTLYFELQLHNIN